MSTSSSSHPNWISYGPDENCTLALCPAAWSVYGYRASLAANVTLMVLFGISMFVSIFQSVKWRTWSFLVAMVGGYICELVGYGGRLMLYQNPFSFPGFIMQIVCISIGPAFFAAAIYLTLAQIVNYIDPTISRITPKLYYWIFIPCDILSLTLQGTGGGLSSNSSGASVAAVDVSIAGLSFQVFTLTLFVLLSADYAVRYLRSSKRVERALPMKFKVFVFFLSLATILILVRCIYRIDELSDGYNGPLIHNEGLFIGLEGVMIIVAAFCLNIAHPGVVFGRSKISAPVIAGDKSEMDEEKFSQTN